MRRSPAQSGFTLIEALLAATLLTLALLLGMALILQQRRIVRRLDAQRAALHEIDATLDALRVGALALVPQRIDPRNAGDPPGLALWVTVQPAGYPPGLWQVSLSAAWRIDGEMKTDRIDTMLWRPPS
jgi:type II secretory pathway pseudopilin PulG